MRVTVERFPKVYYQGYEKGSHKRFRAWGVGVACYAM